MPLTPVNDYTKISTTVAGAQFAPAIAVLSGGGYVIVWHDDDSGRIYAQRFSATGQPVGAELQLDSTQSGSALWVSVAATAADGFTIAFQAGFQNNAEIYARRYDGTNNPVGGLIAVNTSTPNEQCNPHLTALDNGSTLFTWDTRVTVGNDVVVQEIRGRIYDAAGQPISANDFVIAPMAADARNALNAITSLPGGGFVVTWQKGDGAGTNFEIVGQRYTASGGTDGTQFQVNTQTANSQYGNDVARLSDGGFVVTWVDPGTNNVGGRIVARHFGADGNPIGGEIVVDTKASGAYGRTVVTALADGAYVVAWPDGENDPQVPHNVSARAFGSNDQPLDAAFDMSFDSPFGANFFSDGAVTLPNGNIVFAWDGPSINPPSGPSTGQDVYMRQYSFSASGTGPINGTPGPDVLDGTAGDDVINGLDDNDIIDGGTGNDVINGGAGNDLLKGGIGTDTLNGGTGDDSFIVDNAGDVVNEAVGEGNDRVYAGASYVLTAGAEVERMSTTDHAGTAAINLTGNALSQLIFGNAGNNVLDGGGGGDELVGLGGDDNYYVSAGDLVTEYAGGGNDRVYARTDYFLWLTREVETLSTDNDAATTARNLTGNELAQTIIGNAGANILDGGGGGDTLRGLGGNDWYYVRTGDVIEEASNGGSDRLFAFTSYVLNAGASVELMSTTDHAGTGAFNLTGNELAQTIYGNAGNNIIDGGLGADILLGFGGANTFQFTTALGGGNIDSILDFVSGTDRISLDDAVFTGLSTGALPAGAFTIGTTAGDADDRIVYDQASGRLYFDADGNGAGAAVQFATLNAGQVLTASDFTVI